MNISLVSAVRRFLHAQEKGTRMDEIEALRELRKAFKAVDTKEATALPPTS